MALFSGVPGEALFELADEELVQEVLSGRTSRFGLLVRRHERRLRGTVRGVLRDWNEVEDVVQQTFVQAFEALGGYSGAAAFATWLTRIAINEALLQLRRARRVRQAISSLAMGTASFSGTPEQEAGWREAVGRVQAALSGLSDGHREVLLLLADGLTRAEIAERLGIQKGAAKVRVHRARAALQSRVGSPRARVGTPRLAIAPNQAGHKASPTQEASPTTP
jgi:RNA polymerase sigma-70 factor (ECF subfamily)